MSTIALSPYAGEFAQSTEKGEQNVLNPIVKYDPSIEKTSHDRWSMVCKVAAITTAVAFLALALFVTIITAETAPLTAIIILIPGLPSSKGLFDHLWTKAKIHDKKANFAGSVLHEMSLISDEDLASRMDKFGIQPQIENPQLKMLLARYNYLMKVSEEMKDKADEVYSKEAVLMRATASTIKNNRPLGSGAITFDDTDIDLADYTVGSTDFTNPHQKRIFRAKIEAFEVSSRKIAEAAKIKFEAISLLKLMETPTEMDLSQYYQLIDLPLSYRLINAKIDGDRAQSQALVKASDGRHSYTPEQFLDRDPMRLAKEIFKVGQ